MTIRSYLDHLNPAERNVADYILDNSEEIVHSSITKLATNAGVSEATIVKFCQKIGCSGYQELKIFLAKSQNDGGTIQEDHIYGEIEAKDNIPTIINKIFQIYSHSFRSTKKLLENAEIEKSIDLILNAKRVFFFGYGASGIVAEDADLKFKRIAYASEALTDIHTQKTISSLLNSDDLVIAISDSGKTIELITSLKIAKRSGAQIIAITSNMGSPVTDIADIILLTSSKETPFRGSALASRMAQLAVIDVLFLGTAVANYENTLEALRKTRLVMKESKV